jgi:hypothetical protein
MKTTAFVVYTYSNRGHEKENVSAAICWPEKVLLVLGVVQNETDFYRI